MSIHHLENIYTNSYLIRSCWMIAKSVCVIVFLPHLDRFKVFMIATVNYIVSTRYSRHHQNISRELYMVMFLQEQV